LDFSSHKAEIALIRNLTTETP